MISWTGKGVYIPSIFIFLVASMALFGEEHSLNSLSFSIALLITAIFSWLIGKQANRSRSNKHTLLFLSMETWGYLLGALGLLGLAISYL
ncbi:MAG: hypothetical protein ACPGJS_22445 [Flammeovirgaceae bacterium]